MKNRLIVSLLILLCVVTLASCTRKSEGMTSEAKTVATAPADAPKKPEGKRPEGAPPAGPKPEAPPSGMKKPEETTAPVAKEVALPASVVVEEQSNVFEPVSLVYQGPCFLLDATFHETEAEIQCINLNQDQVVALATAIAKAYPGTVDLFTFSMEGSVLHLGYDPMTEAEIHSYWTILSSFVENYSRNLAAEIKTTESLNTTMGRIEVTILPLRATVLLPEGIAKEEIDHFLAAFSAAHPEMKDACTYRVENGLVILSFAEPLATEVVESYWKMMKEDLASYVVEEEPAPVAAPVTQEAQTETKKPVRISEEVPGPTPKSESSKATGSKKASRIMEKSFAVNASIGMDSLYQYSHGVGFSLMGRFEMRVMDQLSVGAKLGLDRGRGIPMALYAKYDLFSDIYLLAAAGARLNTRDMSKSSFLGEVGVGYELEITDELKVFVEGTVRVSGGVGTYLTVGGRYSF